MNSLFLLALALQSSQSSRAVFDAPVAALPAGEFFGTVFDADQSGVPDALTFSGQGSNAKTYTFRLYRDPWHAAELTPESEFDVTFGSSGSNGAEPPRLAQADFDGDGRLDLVVAAREFIVLLTQTQPAGQPAPEFTEQWRGNAFGFVEDFALADLDGDGLLDVAAITRSRLRVWQGTAQASQFTLLPTLDAPTFLGFQALAAGEFDPASSGAELLIADLSEVYLSRVIPAGLPPLELVSTPPFQLSEVTAGDLDGDGDLDALANGPNGDFQVIRQGPLGTWTAEALQNDGQATGLVDVDQDGDLDAVYSGLATPPSSPTVLSANHRFEVMLSDGNGQLTSGLWIQTYGGTRLAGALDVDGDGDVDLIGGQGIYYGRGPLTAAPGIALKPFPINDPINPRLTTSNLIDAEGDGDLDLWGGYGGFSLLGGDWLANSADGSLQPVSGALPPVPASNPGAFWGGPGFPIDYDGDGDPDRLVSLRASDQVAIEMRLLENRGGVLLDVGPAGPPSVDFNEPIGTLFQPTYDADELDRPRWSFAADADADGDQDLFVHRPNATSSRLWINGGSGQFSAVAGTTDKVQAALDLDQDGWIDLVTVNASVQVMWGTGSLQFAPGQGIGGAGPFDTVAVADFDADGRLDVAYPGLLGEAGIAFQVQVGSLPPTFLPVRFDSQLEQLGFLDDDSSDAIKKRAFALQADSDEALEVMVGPVRLGSGSGNLVGVPLYAVIDVAPDRSMELLSVHVLEPEAMGDMDADGDTDLLGTRLIDSLVFDGPTAGLAQQFGTGAAGTPLPGGASVTPTLGLSGIPRAGETIVKHLRGTTAGALTYFAVGFSEAAPPLSVLPGIDQYVLPPFFLPAIPTTFGTFGQSGDGGWDYVFAIDPVLVGLELVEQVLVLDFTGPFGAASSNALRIVIGG